MRFWLLALSFLVTAVPGWTQEFPTDIVPTLTFRETYEDKVMADPDFPGEWIAVPKGVLTINAKASIRGFNISEVDYTTPISISVGDFSYDGTPSDDPDYAPGATTAKVIFEGFNYFGEPVEFGNLTVTWANNQVVYALQLTDATQDYTIVAADYYPDVEENPILRDDLLGAFEFGPYSLDLRTVYVAGSAKLSQDPQDRVFSDLSKVDLDGTIDVTPPKATITQPAAVSSGTARVTVNEAPTGVYDLIGTATDTYTIKGTNYPAFVNRVQVRLSDINYSSLSQGTYVDANVDVNGNWILANTPLFQGLNYLTVVVTDENGNTASTSRKFQYTLEGNVTVTASATGYAPGDSGVLAGTVSGSFFRVGSRKISMVVGSAAPTDTTNHTAGEMLTVTAKAGTTSVFNGWKGTINGSTVVTGSTETFQFQARPNLILTADFVPNPFTAAVFGNYQGLVTGSDAASRGTLKFSLGKGGAFSGLFKVGGVSLPIKGKVLGSGLWSGTVKKGTKTYQVSLNLTMGMGGNRQVTGTVSGNGVNSNFVVDLNAWKSKTHEATAYVGAYNVLFPPTAASAANSNFPQGIGYGRITITKLGTAKFVGKLGDGSTATCSTFLLERTSGPIIPLYISLDKGLGALAGTIAYDSTQPQTDLQGVLDWSEPVTKGVEPQSFAGQLSLQGSRYVKPATGTRVILAPSNGAGKLTMSAPLYTKPTTPPPAALAIVSFSVTLDAATNSVGPLDDLAVKQVKLKFNTATGLFTGTYKDEVLKKTLPISGAATTKANQAGGNFIRGNRTGQIILTP